ncbi:MAG: 4Fe-4S dicluster-binding protein [Candidatus Acidulodesulfobacterium sp.]|nr:4Fe-4S binding protein [Deltaproteobacteria bacterium]MDA8299465.1 4Fe-4S binding protein [Deltaproteobacteria bacterium]
MDFKVGIISMPGAALSNKTGSFANETPVFKHKTCTGCNLCIYFCPEGVIYGDKKTKIYDFDPDYCKGCGICAEECPVDDIEMVLVEK